MHGDENIPTFLTSNIYIRLSLPKSLTVTQLQSYEMFNKLQIVRVNKSLDLGGILKFHILGDAFPFRLAREIPLKMGVLYPPKSKERTPPPHL